MNARIRWQSLSAPVRSRLLALLILVGCILFWMIAIAPALNTLQNKPQMRGQALQPPSLTSPATALTRDASWRALQGVTNGPNIQLTLQGERVTAQLKTVPAADLHQWLMQVRHQAQVVPSEVHLTRASAAETTVWEGRVVLDLPSRDATRSTLR